MTLLRHKEPYFLWQALWQDTQSYIWTSIMYVYPRSISDWIHIHFSPEFWYGYICNSKNILNNRYYALQVSWGGNKTWSVSQGILSDVYQAVAFQKISLNSQLDPTVPYSSVYPNHFLVQTVTWAEELFSLKKKDVL